MKKLDWSEAKLISEGLDARLRALGEEECRDIGMVVLFNNQLTSLPESIARLSNLKELFLEHNELESLPDCIGQLTNLTTLHLDSNKLGSLADWIGELMNLTTLSLGRNKLEFLPEYISQLTNLTALHLYSNKLGSLPKCISQLTNLKMLSLGRNKLEFLPDCIATLTKLTTLSLDSNKLESLPDCIGPLMNLTTLDLHNNQLDSLPDCIGQLTKLESLYTRHNSSLPKDQCIEISRDLRSVQVFLQPFREGIPSAKRVFHAPMARYQVAKTLVETAQDRQAQMIEDAAQSQQPPNIPSFDQVEKSLEALQGHCKLLLSHARRGRDEEVVEEQVTEMVNMRKALRADAKQKVEQLLGKIVDVLERTKACAQPFVSVPLPEDADEKSIPDFADPSVTETGARLQTWRDALKCFRSIASKASMPGLSEEDDVALELAERALGQARKEMLKAAAAVTVEQLRERANSHLDELEQCIAWNKAVRNAKLQQRVVMLEEQVARYRSSIAEMDSEAGDEIRFQFLRDTKARLEIELDEPSDLAHLQKKNKRSRLAGEEKARLEELEAQEHKQLADLHAAEAEMISLMMRLPEVALIFPDLNPLRDVSLSPLFRIQSMDEFEVLHHLTEKVRVVRHILTQRKWVLKEFRAAGSATEMRALVRSVRAMSRISHPSVLELSGVFKDGEGVWWLQFPYLEGGTLRTWIENNAGKKDPSSIIRKLLVGLAYLHSMGITHRDIKPENIFLSADQEPVIGDFDIAFDSKSTELNTTRRWTPGYCAPEVASSRSLVVEPSQDIYSLGQTCYELYTGQTLEPGRGFDLTHIPTPLHALLLPQDGGMLCMAPEKRPTAMQVLCCELFDSHHQPLGTLVGADLRAVRQDLQKLISGAAAVSFTIDRDPNIDPLVAQLLEIEEQAQFMHPWRVRFKGEPGIDAGGLRKEFMNIAFDKLLGAAFEMEDGTSVYKVKPKASSDLLRLAGKLLARACLWGDLLHNARLFAPYIWQYLLSNDQIQFTMTDYRLCEPISSYMQMQRMAVMTDEELASGGYSFEWVSDHEAEQVTTRNVKRFTRARIQESLLVSRLEEMRQLRAGFVLVNAGLMAVLRPLRGNDLADLVCGEFHVTVTKLLPFLRFRGLDQSSEQHFKDMLREIEERLPHFIELCTGSRALPVVVTESDSIHIVASERLEFHTCSRTMNIPHHVADWAALKTAILTFEISNTTV